MEEREEESTEGREKGRQKDRKKELVDLHDRIRFSNEKE